MLSFFGYLIEEIEGSNKHNQAYADAYETATAIHIHKNSGASNDISHIIKKHNDAVAKLRTGGADHLADRAIENAHASANAYLHSLKSQGIHPSSITEVHHTPKGIGHLTGSKEAQSGTPHDVVVRYKTKDGKTALHGTSLKSTSGTASNNTPNVVPGAQEIHDRHFSKQKVLSAMGNKDREAYVKEMQRSDPAKFAKVAKAAKAANVETAAHHAEHFNGLSHAEKVKHVEKLMRYNRSSPVPLDYTVGERGGKSMPYHEIPHVKAVHQASHLIMEHDPNAAKGSTTTHVYSHDPETGQKTHILSIEHRFTHRAFTSPQINAKFGSLKSTES